MASQTASDIVVAMVWAINRIIDLELRNIELEKSLGNVSAELNNLKSKKNQKAV